MVFGKVICGLIGLAAGGIPGLVVGLLVGHAFDRGLGKTFQFGSPENVARIRDSFFETTFLLSGVIAKADGQISQAEIEHTEKMFTQMGLDAGLRRRAIALFHQGAAPEFDVESAVRAFLGICGAQRQLQQTLLLFLVSLAHADRSLAPAEHAALVRIAGLMGLAAAQLEQLVRMVRAQGQFRQQGDTARQAGDNLAHAYAALGVDSSTSDKALKRAYRRLMSEHHPDKLIAKGVPEDMVRLATERAQEIQAAYETIRKSRAR
ncbi:MAG: co-chaperone DjlA [Halioglobus sp.]|nr:co-chaperone DjlA [Halioglobus sp.]